MVTTREALRATTVGPNRSGLRIDRYFTTAGTHPYDELDWELRDAVINDWRTGAVSFEQRDVEFPTGWSVNATTIVAQKYFRGTLGSPTRERSVKHMIDRVADTITGWGVQDGYFADEGSAEVFNHELKHLLVTQKAAFNSPVWFNCGVEETPQCSACFILAVEDTMGSILNWYVEEGTIFKGGSGSGVNLSRIRSSSERLKGGGEASGPVSFMRGADASAGTIKCLHRDTELVTDGGVLPIGEIQVGTKVLTRYGFKRVDAVHDNGVRPLVRVRTGLGDEIVCTPEHRFWVRGAHGEGWREARDLRPDDHLVIDLGATQSGTVQELTPVAPEHHNEIPHALPETLDEALALWLGWIFGDGSITWTESSKFVALQLGDKDPELVGRYTALTRTLFGERAHLFVSRHADRPDASASVRFCSSQVIRFLESNGLRKQRAADLRIPPPVKSSPAAVRAAFLSGLFEADGHIGNGYPQLSTISAGFAREVHRLLLSIGIPSKLGVIQDRRTAFGTSPVHTVRVIGGVGVGRFAKLVGFISERKSRLLEEAVQRKEASPYETQWVLPHASAESLYVQATVEPAAEGPTFDLTVADVHEYLVHGVVTHNSGGKTRRAAKMVILNVDHPDIEEFIWCKQREELKARALREAGFDMDLDGVDSASVQYQNANNSVRVNDEFMRAVEEGGDFDLMGVTDGEVKKSLPAGDLMRQIARAAWECADPGMQYDTTINDWHTTPNAGRINGSNPCCFTGETLVWTTEGPVAFELIQKAAEGRQPLPSVPTWDASERRFVNRPVLHGWVAGQASVLTEVTTTAGASFRCTPEHRFLTRSGEYVEAQLLQLGTELHALEGYQRVAAIRPVVLDQAVPVYDLEVAGLHNFPVTTEGLGNAVVVHNSEYMHLDNSACNLASLNLRKFEQGGVFDVDAFTRAVEIIFTAQEIVVGNSSYPTERIAENAKAYRQLGLGYANLGGLLMSQGLAYDSDEGREWAAAITALMTGHAYRTSAELARVQGPFDGFAADRDGTLRVIAKHRAAVEEIDPALAPANILQAARASWTEALELGTEHGIRNAQASVLAPTGCLVGGSLVATERGLVRLASLGDPAGEQWQEVDIQVGTDEGPRQATQFYVNGPESVVTVDTARGYRIQGTPRHRIRVVDAGGNWTWKRFSDLAEGDRVPLALNQLVGQPQAVDLPPLAGAYLTGEHHARAPRSLTPELAEFVGYFMGDGSLHARGIRLCVAEQDFDVVEHLSLLGKELFGLEGHVSAKTGYTEVAFNSVRLVEWFQACGFAKHRPNAGHAGKGWSPHIPGAILHSNDRAVYAAFLRGLFEADGTVTVDYPLWATRSLPFSSDVQALLLALGLPTTRRFHTTGWGKSQLAVLRLLNSSYNEPWLTEVGFVSARKNAAVGIKDGARSARHDKIPVSRDLIDRLAPGNGRLRRVMLLEHSRSGSVSRRIAAEAFQATGDAELDHLLGFFYDTVATAELGEDELTYDLSVPDNVTYIANGFISHNTIGLMMDCDTTGIEPDLGLVKMKKMVGGGSMKIVNHTVPVALHKLGYQPEQIEAIVGYIDEHATVEGAPAFRTEHLTVFDCAMGERSICAMGHVNMMAAVQPFLSGAISKCVVGDTLLPTEDGLIRIDRLHRDEAPDSFRDEFLKVGSLGGPQKTNAFYYGGRRAVRKVTLRSGHSVTGTENHRVMVASEASAPVWRHLDEVQPGEHVATHYGTEMWSALPARFDDFVAIPPHGSQKAVRLPEQMTAELAFLLGAYAAEGHVSRSNWTIVVTNGVDSVLERVRAAWASEFGVAARIVRQPGKCPGVVLASKTIVEFLDYLRRGSRASEKRIPDAVLRSPREMMLAFLQGLFLDADASVAPMSKLAVCMDSPKLLDDLQAVLTNLGVVHSRISKYNATHDKSYDELYAVGAQAVRLAQLVPFMEPDKAARAAVLPTEPSAHAVADVVPGISGEELYRLLPAGTYRRNGRDVTKGVAWRFLRDARSRHVSRGTLQAVAAIDGVRLPAWLQGVLDDDLHFSPVESVEDAGTQEVFDLSVPANHAFVGNGIVNHNTVNLPESATVSDVEELYMEGWRLGLKAIAIYRDNCKVAQPLSIEKRKAEPAATTVEAAEHGMVRRRLPKQRPSQTISFAVGDAEGYLTAGEYPGDGLGEIFVKLGKQGSTLSGVMDAFAIAVSLGLQYGVPLEEYVKKFTNMRFEPAGMTDDPEVKFASSILDYIFRRLAIEYLPADRRQSHGIYTLQERQAQLDAQYGGAPATVPAEDEPKADAEGQIVLPVDQPKPVDDIYGDAPLCYSCGVKMQRAGSCHVCASCGTTSGCS